MAIDTEEAERRGGDRMRLKLLEQQMHAATTKLQQVCDEVRTVLAEWHANAGKTCPAPGKCLELNTRMERVEVRVTSIERTMTWAKGAAWGLGALGLANLLGLAANFFKA
jgi:hypothetical protein